MIRPFTLLVCGAVGALLATTPTSRAAEVNFARDIQPIFAKECYECHGPDKQKGKLRLDTREAVFQARGNGNVSLVPGDPAASELYRRITLPKGHDDIMPNRGEPLSEAQKDLIRDWIAQGAVWPENAAAVKHWSYVAPTRPQLPEIKDMHWVNNPIDAFVLARLEKENLRPSPETDRARLLRRVYLDLIGLPPSPSEVEAFLADTRADAYERVVEKLLQSPHYGERWARPWLDLARYADSIGFQRDNLWTLWPYRDWVIEALNADMPFNRFTIEQIAGDLLPDATLAQKIATGFNRCAPTNIEAGSDQEETRVNQILDRVNTVSTAWLGSTIECAQCHDHKYDPFSQKEYFQLFAFFNNTPQETDFNTPSATAALKLIGPYLSLPDEQTGKERAALQSELESLDQQIKAATEKLLPGQQVWVEKLAAELATATRIHLLDVADFKIESDSFHQTLGDKSLLLRANDNAAIPDKDTYTITVRTKVAGITGFKLETLTDPSLPGGGPGRGDEKRPNFVLTDFSVTVTASGEEKKQRVEFRAARADFAQRNFPAANAIDADPKTGWAINPEFFKDHWAIFETKSPVGSADGATFVFKLRQDYGGARTIGRLRLSALTGDATSESVPADIAEIVTSPAGQRTKAQQTRLTNFYLSRQPDLAALKSSRAKIAGRLKAVQPLQTLVMREMETPRSSAVFVRGNFLEHGEPVKLGVPAVLHTLPDGPPDRLTLARWLASPDNPLVARVTVNRWWAEFFGHGLVTTPEDFGIKGDLPTHPELLDWLAVEFMERGWSMKHIHKLIATSATYRQSAGATADLLEADAENKLYARGPRFRMDAEMIRDNALAAAGLLSAKMGGPPVRPYQPPGIWESKVGGERVTYDISEGEDRFRRGIYTVWKRTSPYPSFITFDAPTRNACTVRRPRSNTPLQALTLLNDPVYVEAAKALVRRVLVEKSSAGVPEKIRYAFQLTTSRMPAARELEILTRLYEEQLQASRKDSGAAGELFREFSAPEGIDAAEFAAWYSVASALLNLDETITKG